MAVVRSRLTVDALARWGGVLTLVVGAAVPPLRPVAATLLAVGWAGLRAQGHPAARVWAAAIPVSVTFVWPWLVGTDVPLGAGCTEPLSLIAVRRLLVVLAVLGLTALLATAGRHGRDGLALRVPSRAQLGLAVLGAAVIAVGGVVLGPLVARPFFGELDFPRPLVAVVPALLFGVSNGIAEEVAYRGALQGWLGASLGRWTGIGVQALVFGLVHAGPDVVALLPVHVAILGGAGLVAGLIVDRTRSLAIPIGVHVGADVALYFGLACRAALATP